VKQSPEVLQAYHVCETFERLLGENLDFDRAYEATFTKDNARRREIAIADGEFGDLNYTSIDGQLLVKAYKLRMQILYLLLPLTNPSDKEQSFFFPPKIKEILERKGPRLNRDFPSYVTQLEQDAAVFRSHLNTLVARDPSVAERVNGFKSEALAATFEPPADTRVTPQHGYYRSNVLDKDESYYEIKGYSVAKDGRDMKIIGIRFFNRLF